jgi:hypothetical protein
MRFRLEHRRAGEPAPPDFIGVGALGSGTGWWHAMLLAHPEIRPPHARRRALHHFDRFCAAEMTDADVAAYHARFQRRPGTITGEWTGRYMFDGWTPPLLRRAAPEAKLLVMISDPIERYRAIFTQRLAKHGQPDTIYTTDIVDRRSFAAQLTRLHRFFPPERILVLQFERCRRDPLTQYRRTLEFLGVRDRDFAPRRLRRKAAGKPEALHVQLLLRLGLPEGTKRRIAERITGRPNPVETVALWPELEASLHVALDPDVKRLREVVPDLDLSLWPNFAHLGDQRAAAGAEDPSTAPESSSASTTTAS